MRRQALCLVLSFVATLVSCSGSESVTGPTSQRASLEDGTDQGSNNGRPLVRLLDGASTNGTDPGSNNGQCSPHC